MRSNPISFDGYGSKIRKINRCRLVVLNKTILATRQELFFTKAAPIQSITNIVLVGFKLMLPSWMFISFYATICFFIKKFIFSNVFISVNRIVECLLYVILVMVYRKIWLGNYVLLIIDLIININLDYLKKAGHNLLTTNTQEGVL